MIQISNKRIGFCYNNTDNSMGATMHKSFKNIIDSKYSFSHPKAHLPLQISAWKFVEEELESAKQCLGESMRWPFKFYSDQGYIITTITNHNANNNQIPTTVIDKRIAEVKTTISMLQILYSFFHGEIQEYFVEEILIENQSKYVNEVLSFKVYIYVGENLSSQAKIKLMSYGIQLGRYVSRGGICSVSKLYHEYQQITELQNQIKLSSSLQKHQQYYVSLTTLLQENADKDKRQEEVVFSKLAKYSLISKVLFQDFLQVKTDRILSLKPKKGKRKQPLYPTCEIITKTKLIIKGPEKVKEAKGKIEAKKEIQQMNESLPFQCEITEINIKQKKANIDQSNIMDQLSVLNQRPNSQFVKVMCEQQDYLVITDYTSLRDSKKCAQFNAQLIINLAPHSCYNYYLNEINYLYYYLSPVPNKLPADAVLFQNNIEHIILQITQSIMQLTINNKANNTLNNRVIIHSSGSLFSDENCAVVIGYLMSRYLYTYQKAFSVVNKHYKTYKQDEKSQLLVNKIYVDQLLTLQGRILMASVPNYGVSINVNNWRVYQVSNNHSCPAQSLIARFVGQIANPNQLTSLPNSNHHCYVVISHQIVSILTQLIEKWQKQSSMKIPQGIKGISVYFGKQFEVQLKDSFLAKCKKQIPLILKYQFFNRNKRIQTFNNEFCFKFIENIVSNNLQVQIIEKSFRKAQPFTPLYIGFEEDNPAKQKQKAILPHNSKQKLIFKYPYLRPTWENIKDDQYYFIVQITKGGAMIKMIKGKNWAGYQVDKELYFQNIVRLYLKNISEQKIWVNQQGDQSIFNDPLDP